MRKGKSSIHDVGEVPPSMTGSPVQTKWVFADSGRNKPFKTKFMFPYFFDLCSIISLFPVTTVTAFQMFKCRIIQINLDFIYRTLYCLVVKDFILCLMLELCTGLVHLFY